MVTLAIRMRYPTARQCIAATVGGDDERAKTAT